MQTEWEPSDLKRTGIVDSKQGKIYNIKNTKIVNRLYVKRSGTRMYSLNYCSFHPCNKNRLIFRCQCMT
jgi:hypothetical protein